MGKEKEQKRYAALYTLYIYAENDIDARIKAKKLEALLRSIDDSQASCDELWEKGFGSKDKLRNVEL